MRSKKLAALAAAAATGITLSACGYQQAGPGVIGVVQKGGWTNMTSQELIDCINPSQSKGEFNNTVYWYPAHQISWSATDDKGSDRGPYDVVSSREAAADMLVPLTVSFDLTEDCAKLKQFHQRFGIKYQGWINQDGTETDGWKQLLNYVIGQPLQNTLSAVSQGYPWQQIWNDEKVRKEFTEALDKDLPEAARQRTEGVQYFEHWQVMVYKPRPASQKLIDTINEQQANIQAQQSAQAAADAQKLAADAQTRAQEAEANKKRAEIAGYPSVEDYLRAQAIEKGMNPFQPTIVPFH